VSWDESPRILRHALRSRILTVIAAHGEASPSDVAVELGAPIGNVSYHTKVLLEAGWIELVRIVPRRGGRRHVYRVRVPPYIDDPTWELLPLTLRRGLARDTLTRAIRAAMAALADGGFDEAGAHVDVVSLHLDDEGVRELSGELVALLDRVLAIQRRCDARGDGAGRSQLALLHYRLAAGDAADGWPRRPAGAG
jgi:DNA-binding transcriptional ArsR family regulator